MSNIPVWIRKNLSGLIHPKMRSFILRHISLLDKRTQWWVSQDPFRNEPPHSQYKSRYPVTLGIIKEFWHRHWPYIAACRDLEVAYKVIDISGPDWIDAINNSGCDAFLVWPSIQVSIWKQMYDERLKIITEDLKKTIYPTYQELWFYESKRRMYYWLKANNLPHAETWIFYDKDKALDFAKNTPLPIVVKTNLGARASGTHIFRSRKKLLHFIKRCFGRGVVHFDGEARDTEWGFVYLQEYLPDAREWRTIRIGDSFFGYEKLKVGDFHSGSRTWRYAAPSDDLLNFTKKITDLGNFSSMDVDIFIDKNNNYLINELQTVFGMGTPYEVCVINGKPGRMLLDTKTEKWRFESGEFCQNYLCNLRIQYLCKKLTSQNY